MGTKDWLDYLNIGTQIVANVFVIIGFIYAYKQYKLYKHEVNTNLEIERSEKAIEVAKLFAENLLEDISDLLDIFEEIGLQDIMNKVKSEKMKNFTCIEMNRIIDKNELEMILGKLKELSKTNQEKFSNISKVLNQLEYMSMYFNTGIAEEKTVYQSLHQLYLSFVKEVYPVIAFANVNNKDKAYINVIKLFNVWNERYIENSETEKELFEQSVICAKNSIEEINKKGEEIIVSAPSIKK